MLPYYPSGSVQNKRILLRVSRYGRKANILRKIEKGIYNELKSCPKCKQIKNIHDFVRVIYKKESVKKTSYCLACRTKFNRRYNDPRIFENKWKDEWKKKKLQAFQRIAIELKCVRCGCDDLRFLEINHKNGKDPTGGGTSLYYDVAACRRKTDDLELLCRPCNHIHYLEMKFGEKIPLRVIYGEP